MKPTLTKRVSRTERQLMKAEEKGFKKLVFRGEFVKIDVPELIKDVFGSDFGCFSFGKFESALFELDSGGITCSVVKIVPRVGDALYVLANDHSVQDADVDAFLTKLNDRFAFKEKIHVTLKPLWLFVNGMCGMATATVVHRYKSYMPCAVKINVHEERGIFYQVLTCPYDNTTTFYSHAIAVQGGETMGLKDTNHQVLDLALSNESLQVLEYLEKLMDNLDLYRKKNNKETIRDFPVDVLVGKSSFLDDGQVDDRWTMDDLYTWKYTKTPDTEWETEKGCTIM